MLCPENYKITELVVHNVVDIFCLCKKYHCKVLFLSRMQIVIDLEHQFMLPGHTG